MEENLTYECVSSIGNSKSCEWGEEEVRILIDNQVGHGWTLDRTPTVFFDRSNVYLRCLILEIGKERISFSGISSSPILIHLQNIKIIVWDRIILGKIV